MCVSVCVCVCVFVRKCACVFVYGMCEIVCQRNNYECLIHDREQHITTIRAYDSTRSRCGGRVREGTMHKCAGTRAAMAEGQCGGVGGCWA